MGLYASAGAEPGAQLVGKRLLAGDTARAATSSEVTELRREARALKEAVAEQALELRLPKRSMIADGGDGQ
jgi:transposase